MTHKSALKKYASDGFNALRKKWELLGQEQVGRKLIASVLSLINEMELSIYRFLSSGAKNNKR